MLIPVMGHRMKFLQLIKNAQSEESTTTVRPLQDSASEVQEVDNRSAFTSKDSASEVQEVDDRGASTSKDPQTTQQTRYFLVYGDPGGGGGT